MSGFGGSDEEREGWNEAVAKEELRLKTYTEEEQARFREGVGEGHHVYGHKVAIPIHLLNKEVTRPFIEEVYKSLEKNFNVDARGFRPSTTDSGGDKQPVCPESKPIQFGSQLRNARSDPDSQF